MKATARTEAKSDQSPEDSPSLSTRFQKLPWLEPLGEKIPTREIIAEFSQYVLKYKSPLIQAFFAFFVASTLQSVVPLSTKFVIDTLLPSGNYTLLWLTALALIILFLLRAVISVLGNHLLIFTSTHVVFELRRRLFQHLQLLHLAFYEREQSGKLVAKLINDAASLQTMIQSAMPVIAVNTFTIFITLVIMFTLNTKLTLFAMAVMPMYFIVSYFFKQYLYKRSMEIRERNSVVAGNINEVITGIKVVKSFAMEDQEQKRFVNMIRENLTYEIDLGTVQTIRGNSLEFLTGLSRALVLLLGGAAVMNLNMTTGDYVAFMTFIMMLFNPMLQFSNLTIQLVQARTGLERILHILRIQPKITDRPHARAVKELEGHVQLENVTFKYESGPPVLYNIDLEAKPGECVALVGPSGSGKSSVVNLLTRFYDPTDGRVLIDGVDIRNLQAKSYRNRIGIVLQEPFLFSGTILDNICYGSGRATYEEVEEAARQANALEFIEQLPDGMDTQVGERGQLLSGGQRQRVAIARAFLRDPDILILDEATSALDTHSEKLVQQALDRLLGGRTVFIVAHRLSTIQNADKIVVLNHGRVAEIGTHHELLKRGGIYASLYLQTTEGATVETIFENAKSMASLAETAMKAQADANHNDEDTASNARASEEK